MWREGAAMLGSVVGSEIFYNDSHYDGNDPSIQPADGDVLTIDDGDAIPE